MTNLVEAPSKGVVDLHDVINLLAKEQMIATGRHRSPLEFAFPLILGI
jgi:hypothetical protein